MTIEINTDVIFLFGAIGALVTAFNEMLKMAAHLGLAPVTVAVIFYGALQVYTVDVRGPTWKFCAKGVKKDLAARLGQGGHECYL